jgi:hypothetical protein
MFTNLMYKVGKFFKVLYLENQVKKIFKESNAIERCNKMRTEN